MRPKAYVGLGHSSHVRYAGNPQARAAVETCLCAEACDVSELGAALEEGLLRRDHRAIDNELSEDEEEEEESSGVSCADAPRDAQRLRRGVRGLFCVG
jgi:hypothetical protein